MNKQYSIYDIDLEIDTEKQLLYSNVKMNFHCNIPSVNILNFYIYKDIEVEEIKCDRTISYDVGKEIADWSPFIKKSKLIKILFDQPLSKNENVNIEFKYKGSINIIAPYGENRLTKDWVELGIYTPWFPLYEKIEQAYFNVNIKMGDEYKVINSKKTRDYSTIHQLTPQLDCSIIASKCFSSIVDNFENVKLNVYYTKDKHKDVAKKISNYSSMILNKYKQFGKTDSQELSIAIVPREVGGGYCRPGLIVLPPNDKIKNEVDYFKYLAHELAHLWWCNYKIINTWEDWLNESFAEFSALLAVREIFGEEEFNRKISIYTQSTKDLPPIKNLDRGHDKAYEVLYKKGPLVLNELKVNIGKEKFRTLLNEVYINNIDTTDKFLDKLCELTSKKTKDDFNMLLLK